MQRKAQEAQVSTEQEEKMMRNLEKRETEYMRLQRHKVGIDDFEQLTVIGKGAFGEVFLFFDGTEQMNNLDFQILFAFVFLEL